MQWQVVATTTKMYRQIVFFSSFLRVPTCRRANAPTVVLSRPSEELYVGWARRLGEGGGGGGR